MPDGRGCPADDGRARIRIEATDLPGRSHGPAGGPLGYGDVHVGVQPRDRPEDLLGLCRADADRVEWTLDCVTSATPAGLDVKGRHIHGRPGQRFIYLSWGVVDPDGGGLAMFRRAKLMLDAVPAEVLAAAERSGVLVGRLGLTDHRGQPLCAAVRPPAITWTAAAA
ncbi:MAG: monooxygenase [Frankia sp.]|nr:monooxygenase [Frankia sp.]